MCFIACFWTIQCNVGHLCEICILTYNTDVCCGELQDKCLMKHSGYVEVCLCVCVPGLRPAVRLTSLATVSSSDWMVTVMQYISLVSAGGSWWSCTEIRGTRDMILFGKHIHFHLKIAFLECTVCSIILSNGFWVSLFCKDHKILTNNIHGASLDGDGVPVDLLLWDTDSPLKRAGCLQCLVARCSVTASSPPVQIHTAAALTAQHQLHMRDLNQRSLIIHEKEFWNFFGDF